MVHPLRVGVVAKNAVPLTDPAGMIRLAGTCSPLLVDIKLTVVVEEGAARVTVHVPEAPGTTLLGAQVRVDRVAAALVNESV